MPLVVDFGGPRRSPPQRASVRAQLSGIVRNGVRRPESVSAFARIAHLAVGSAQDALESLERAVADSSHLNGAVHPDTLAVRSAAAMALLAVGRVLEARDRLEVLAPECRAALGAADPTALETRRGLALSYLRSGRQMEGRTALRRLRGEVARTLGSEHPISLLLQRDLAGPLPYDGPYIAAGDRRHWVFVASDTRPLAERFLWPRPTSARLDALMTSPMSLSSGGGRPAAHVEESPDSDVPPSEPAEEEPHPQAAMTGAESREAAAPAPGASLVVRVLGPVEVEGWSDVPERPVVVELLCYLALHRGRPVHGDELRLALRPDAAAEVSATTLRTYLSHLRRAVGPAVLPPATAGGYQLGDHVTCDWECFQELTGERAGAEELAAALALVRGRPFASTAEGTFPWIYTELLVSSMEVAIAGAARRLAEVALSTGDLERAGWAVRQGLAGVPNDYNLLELHLGAARRVSPQALRRAEDEVRAALGDDADDLIQRLGG